MIKSSFQPVIPTSAKLLILGSLPGDKSLLANQYYAHPQNRFWKLLFTLFDKEYTINYAERLAFLHEHQIALWDVCASAIRPGSMDHAIEEEIPNPINKLIVEQQITSVFFNGQKASKLYTKFFPALPSVAYTTLPSTSPANASFTLEKLLREWEVIRV